MSRATNISMDTETIHDAVRERYAAAALSAGAGSCCEATCCGGERGGTSADGVAARACCGDDCCGDAADPITSDLYAASQTEGLPDTAVRASLGCGNPAALAELFPGETVLDLGSGGGLDVLLSARRVGPSGRAYGLDMTDEMLDLARRNAAEAGAENVEFLRGRIEAIPLSDASVDIVISNCVINLAPDKDAVLREAYRVLRPGGRFAVSDVVAVGELAGEVRRDLEAWAGCVAGALGEAEYREKLSTAGFREVELEVTRTYSAAETLGHDGDAGGTLASAFVRGLKPR